MSWNYVQPVEIIFETGGIKKLDDYLSRYGYSCGVLICDPFFASNGFADKIAEYSGDRIKEVYSEVTPNPQVDQVDKACEMIKRNDANFVIAFGGGSAIDCAKLGCALAVTDSTAREIHTGAKALTGGSVPLIAVPTTAGTGSEVTSVSVLSDPERHVKAPVGHASLFPKIALIDPELTLSVPAQVTASTGLDVLSHALEGFWSKNHQPICDAVALSAARLVFENLFAAYEDGSNLLAREKMCEASVMAGLAFCMPKTAASHAISFPLTNVYGMPHGEACAFTLDSLCAINAEVEDGRLNKFAVELGFENAKAMGDEITQLKKAMGMKTTLREAGIPSDKLFELVQLCHHPNLDNNPVALSDDDLMLLFKSKTGEV